MTRRWAADVVARGGAKPAGRVADVSQPRGEAFNHGQGDRNDTRGGGVSVCALDASGVDVSVASGGESGRRRAGTAATSAIATSTTSSPC